MALSGPTLAPARGPATHLVVLVHGYGADGQDLLGLANHWQGLLPTVAFAAPNAPTRVPGSPGYQWFPISRIDPHEMQKGVEVAGPQLDEYLDGELARLGLPPENLALAGFSQGTMLSLHVGLRRKVRPAAIVGFSGLLAGLPRPGDPAPGHVPGRRPAGRCRGKGAMAPGAGHGPWHRSRRAGHCGGISGFGVLRPAEKPGGRHLRPQTVMTNRLAS
jgi:phospholipase/carboxylesterase